MANVTISGYARTNTGTAIPLRAASQAEGSEVSVGTDASFTTTSQDIGSYMPGATILSLEMFAPNGILYAFVLRQGIVLSWASVNTTGVNSKEQMLSVPVQLRPGDTIRCKAVTAASRDTALCVTTNQGVSRIFVATGAAGAFPGEELVDLQNSANGIGDTLQGQTIIRAIYNAGGSQAQMPTHCGGAMILNASSQLAGVIPATNPVNVEGLISSVNIPISLNWSAFTCQA